MEPSVVSYWIVRQAAKNPLASTMTATDDVTEILYWLRLAKMKDFVVWDGNVKQFNMEFRAAGKSPEIETVAGKFQSLIRLDEGYQNLFLRHSRTYARLDLDRGRLSIFFDKADGESFTLLDFEFEK